MAPWGLPEAPPPGTLNYLVTEFGKPFSPDGFGNRFKAWCVKAGLPHCSAHRLRKAGAAFAAENGATENQPKTMSGWRGAKMAARALTLDDSSGMA
jgi:integrase